MNSMSKMQQQVDCDSSKILKKSCPVIIKCSSPGSAIIPDATVVGTSFTISSLTLNSSCLCNPCILLEFTSNIAILDFTGSISFQVFKLCNGQFQPIPIGTQWTYSVTLVDEEAVTGTDIFSFFICDCDSCFSDCCTYSVVVTVDVITEGTLSINNVTLGAIASSSSEQCC